MRCIFCLEERDPSVEHVFPEAIGGVLTIDRVCTSCNSWLGSNVDALLTDHTLVLAKRNQLRIPNSRGKTPTWHDAFGLGSLASDPQQRVKMVQNPETGQIQPTLIYKDVRTKTVDGDDAVSITIDASQADEIPKIIQRERKRAGLQPLPDEELHQISDQLGSNVHELKQPEVVHKLKIDLRDFMRAISKIAYEFAWRWFGDEYLVDPTGADLRNYVLYGIENSNIKGKIEFGFGTGIL